MRGCEKEKSEIKKLKEKIKQLRAHLAVFRGIQRTVNGTTGEIFIQKLAKGSIKTIHNASYDIVTKRGNKIELKTAQCLPVDHYKETPCYRWGWRYVIRPNKKRKYYDYLILIGNKDKRYNQNDLDRTPYVYFFLSYEQVKKILSPDDHYAQINLTTNFETVRGKQGKKLLGYRKSFKEIIQLLKRT